MFFVFVSVFPFIPILLPLLSPPSPFSSISFLLHLLSPPSPFSSISFLLHLFLCISFYEQHIASTSVGFGSRRRRIPKTCLSKLELHCFRPHPLIKNQSSLTVHRSSSHQASANSADAEKAMGSKCTLLLSIKAFVVHLNSILLLLG
ncbi:hypothetical protein GQ43DRAFT_214902 [Delitschia confertaspora ATCC 74209]|uniref:Uncharacterized protein n=1 Tax=Delitschia confertaspora ATCC 74209 TaxID=1513339 RepID=A0A9P4JQW0_9PLEO|nr:hypothetical protein GQ43DRAFT_214902 [Delitschia confertaspora ATCC 74209]